MNNQADVAVILIIVGVALMFIGGLILAIMNQWVLPFFIVVGLACVFVGGICWEDK